MARVRHGLACSVRSRVALMIFRFRPRLVRWGLAACVVLAGATALGQSPAPAATSDEAVGGAAVPPELMTVDVPASVIAGEAFRLELRAPAPVDLLVELWPRDPAVPLPGAATPLFQGAVTADVSAPAGAGWYEVRLVAAADGTLLAEAEIEVLPLPSSAVAACGEPADAASLEETFTYTAENLLRVARLGYRFTYADVRYDYTITRAEVLDGVGHVSARYTASAREIATGDEVGTSGTLDATLDWDGCRWTLRDYRF